MAKTHIGILELDRETALPNLRSTKGGVGFEGTTPKYWNGSSWSAFSGSGGGISTWDELYDADKALTIDETTGITWTITAVSGDAFTIASGAGATGDMLQFTNGGSGSDIKGTSDTWSVSKAGAIVGTALTMGDDQAITLGATSDAVIQWVNASSYVDIQGAVNFDGNVTIESAHTLTLAGAGITVTAGDSVFADGSLAITDADNDSTLVITNGTVTTGNTVVITADAATNGSILYIDNGNGTLDTGFYINCNDDGTSDFTVAKDGATTITTAVNSTKALVVTGIQTSENLVHFDNATGVIASDKAVLLLDAGGNVASGGNILRVEANGTPNAGAIGIEFDGEGKTLQALYIDADPTASHVVHFHGGGALTDGLAVLALTNDGNLATGGNLLNVTVGGSPNAGAIAVEIAGATKAMTALSVDSDPTASDTVLINGGGALTNGFAVLSVKSDGNLASGGNTLKVTTAGTPASGAMYAEFDFTGITDTNENVGVKIDANGKKVVGLYVDADPLANSAVYFVSQGALAADKATLEIASDVATCNADSSVIRVTQDSTTGVAFCMTLKQDDLSEPFINFETTAGAGNSIDETANAEGTAIGFLRIAINGTDRYLTYYGAPTGP
jgi:hypothetical protein